MICCARGCGRPGAVLHLMVGDADRVPVSATSYLGLSFCSWEHLGDWLSTDVTTDKLGVTLAAAEVGR